MYGLSGIKLFYSSFLRLYIKRIITCKMARRMLSSSGYLLSQDDMRDIYNAVNHDHNKLRDFAEILLLSCDTSSLAINLLQEYCKYRV